MSGIDMKDLDKRIRGIDEALLALMPYLLGSLPIDLLRAALDGMPAICEQISTEGHRRVHTYMGAAVEVHAAKTPSIASELRERLTKFRPD